MIWALRRPAGPGLPARRDRGPHDAVGRGAPALRRAVAACTRWRIPNCRAYDPAFAYEVGVLVRDGIRRMYGPEPEDCFYYLTLYNENYVQPPMPEGVEDGIVRGMYRFQPAAGEHPHRAQILASGPMVAGGARRAEDARRALRRRRRRVERSRLEAAPRRRARCERWNRLHPKEPPRTPYVTELLADTDGPVVAVTDWVQVGARLHRPVRARSPTSCSAPTATASPTCAPRCGATSRSTPPTWWSACSTASRRPATSRPRSWPRRSRRYEIDPDSADPRTRLTCRRRRGCPRPGAHRLQVVVRVPVVFFVFELVVEVVVVSALVAVGAFAQIREGAGAFPEQPVVVALLELRASRKRRARPFLGTSSPAWKS